MDEKSKLEESLRRLELKQENLHVYRNLFDKCLEEHLFSKDFQLDDLFIRSYLIETTYWNKHSLQKILRKGKLYLVYKQLIAEPVKFFSTLFRTLMIKPASLIKYIK